MIIIFKNMRGGDSTLHLHFELSANERRTKIGDNNCKKICCCHQITCNSSNSVTIDCRKSPLGCLAGVHHSNCPNVVVIFHRNYLNSALCVKVLLACVDCEMDLLRTPSGLRKKSSLFWNSLRLPRKHKGELRLLTQCDNRCEKIDAALYLFFAFVLLFILRFLFVVFVHCLPMWMQANKSNW